MASLSALLNGCMVGPDYEQPNITANDSWQENSSLIPTTTPLKDIAWWKNFRDPILDQLIQESVKTNLDVETALAKIRQARTTIDASTANLFPTLTGLGSVTKSQNSKNISSSAIGSRQSNLYAGKFAATWELDLFGRLQRAEESAGAKFESAIDDGRSVILALLGDVSQNYIKLRNYQQQLQIMREMADAWADYIALRKGLEISGYATDIDLLSAETSYNQMMARIPTLEAIIKVTINQICFLLGRGPGFFTALLGAPTDIPQADPVIFSNLPAGLLLNRPDIRSAERQLASETATIGVATGNLLPTFSLTGGYNWTSAHSSNLLTNKSIGWSVGPSISLPIFDFGKLQAAVDAQYAVRDQAFISFKKAILTALHDVENALTNFASGDQNLHFLKTAMDSNELAYKLSLDRNKSGLSDSLDIAPLKIMYLTSKQDYLNGVCSRSVNMINVYKALGGGWDVLSVQDKELNTKEIDLVEKNIG